MTGRFFTGWTKDEERSSLEKGFGERLAATYPDRCEMHCIPDHNSPEKTAWISNMRIEELPVLIHEVVAQSDKYPLET